MMSDIITSPNSAAAQHAVCERLVIVGVLPTGETFLFNVKELSEAVGDIVVGDPAQTCQELLRSEPFIGFSVTRIYGHVLSESRLPNHHYVVVEFGHVPEGRWPVGWLPFMVTADMFPHCLRSRDFDADLKQIARWLRERRLIAA